MSVCNVVNREYGRAAPGRRRRAAKVKLQPKPHAPRSQTRQDIASNREIFALVQTTRSPIMHELARQLIGCPEHPGQSNTNGSALKIRFASKPTTFSFLMNRTMWKWFDRSR